MPNTVRCFTSEMTGAPSLSGTAGTLIGVLDACLVDGFGSVTVNSLVVASNVATATVSGGHQCAMLGTTGPVLRLSGASPPGLNGDWRVTVTDSTHFTFATSGISDQTATGTISAKRAPAWCAPATDPATVKVFTGTNKAVYRSDDITGNRLYLRVADAGVGSASYARVCGYEVMTDVDTGTGVFPTEGQISGGGYWYKSNGANATVRGWTLVADSRSMVLFVNQDGTIANSVAHFFGDIVSDHASDAYGSLIIVGISSSMNSTFQAFGAAVAGHYLARSYTQTGTASTVCKYSHGRSPSYMGYEGATYPNPGNNLFLCSSVEIWDSATVERGTWPGLYAPLHAVSALTDGATITNISGLSGRELLIKRMIYAGVYAAVAVDITGPWR